MQYTMTRRPYGRQRSSSSVRIVDADTPSRYMGVKNGGGNSGLRLFASVSTNAIAWGRIQERNSALQMLGEIHRGRQSRRNV